MDSLTHFHSRNVYFYIHFSNNLKVTALDMFFKKIWVHTPVKSHLITRFQMLTFGFSCQAILKVDSPVLYDVDFKRSFFRLWFLVLVAMFVNKGHIDATVIVL